MLQAMEWSIPWVRIGVPVAAALAGGALGASGAGRRGSFQGLLIHFAAGTFLAVALLDLLPDAGRRLGWPAALLAAGAGWALSAGLARAAGGFCPGCSGSDGHEAAVAVTPALLLVVAFHCLLDGLALAGGAAHGTGDWISMAVLAHKIPEGMAIAALCRLSGLSLRASIGLTALVEAATFAGYGLALGAGTLAAPLLGAALGITAGSFLFLVLLTLSGSRRAEKPLGNAAAALAGFLVVGGGQLLLAL